MRKKKNINKINKLIIALFGLILITLILSLILVLNTDIENEKNTTNQSKAEVKREETVKAEGYENSVKEFQEFEQKYLEEKILPRNISVLYSYEGKNSRQDVYKSLRTFTEYISYLQKEVNEESSEDYYKDHSKDVYNSTGISEEEDYLKLLNTLKEIDVNSSNLKYAEIGLNSMEKEEEYTSFKVNFYYGENLEKLQLTLKWANSTSTKPEFIYRIE